MLEPLSLKNSKLDRLFGRKRVLQNRKTLIHSGCYRLSPLQVSSFREVVNTDGLGPFKLARYLCVDQSEPI
jgi:hypothetical protein